MMWKFLGMFLLFLSVCFARTADLTGEVSKWEYMTESDLEDSRRQAVERVEAVMEKTAGFGTASLDDLCRHYGFTYSQGMCTNAEGAVPVDRLVRVAANHYPVLGEILSKRRNEAAYLKKLCGKNGGKLKAKILAYAKIEKELRKCSRARRQLYITAQDNAREALANANLALRKVEALDDDLAQVLSTICQNGARTDVSIVKGKRGYRLSANISTTTSPDAIIEQQRYVWETREKDNDDDDDDDDDEYDDEYDEGIDL